MKWLLVVLPILNSFSSAQSVPKPKRVEASAGFVAGDHMVCEEPEFESACRVLAEGLRSLGVGMTLSSTPDEDAVLVFRRAPALGEEAYAFAPVDDHLLVTAATPRGAAYACATLLQTARFPEDLQGQSDLGDLGEVARWPRLTLADEPDLSYRSFMVDMGRNPHSPETLRRVVDMLWFFKGNYLQLHLIDDQLGSWPSAAFPRIYSDRAGWTRADFVALERYAQARGVVLVPELEAPGHSTILRREYPQVFGETPTDLATSPEAQAGLETLLGEMLEVFESTPYVHIGGDEAYGVPQEDQRNLINRLHRFLKEKGRRTLVWEGPKLGRGENKVNEEVIHLNWRTIDFPAQEMLDAGYEVVNASWDPLYIVDHYPRTMFTAVPVERCFDFDIQRFAHINHAIETFAAPHRTKTKEGLLGFCMPWWEGREENLLPLCLPRFAAAASAAWNRAGEDDFEDYRIREERALEVLERVSGFRLPRIPFADPATQADNLAYRARVRVSSGASQPHFGPQRLTNGIPDRFDHFLGYPTQPEALEIVIELEEVQELARIVIHERAVGASHEVYELSVADERGAFDVVGSSGEGTRGDRAYVEHRFPARRVRTIKIATHGCHGLTFPSFSRISEVMAFAE